MESMNIQTKMDVLLPDNGQYRRDTSLHYIWINPLDQNVIEDPSPYIKQCHQSR